MAGSALCGRFGGGRYRIRKRIFSRYEIAQQIDRRLDIKDALSTAFYFAEPSRGAPYPPEFIERQRQMAEQFGRLGRYRPRPAFPRARTLYVNVALALLAFGMFGLRYGVQHNLDLRPPLVRIAFEGFLGPSPDIAEARKAKRPFDEETEKNKSSAADPLDAQSKDADTAAAPSPER